MQDSREKLGFLLEQLRRQTQANRLKWEPSVRPNVFQTAFPHYTIQIECRGLESVVYLLRILNEEGIPVEELNEFQLQPYHADPSALLGELFAAARRQALGANRAIDELVEFLKS